MLTIIQEFIRKINSFLVERLSFIDFMAIIGVILIISGLFVTLTIKDFSSRKEVTYMESDPTVSQFQAAAPSETALIVASKNGKTYLYSWCKGVEKIKLENKITFSTENDAKGSGRYLASSCMK